MPIFPFKPRHSPRQGSKRHPPWPADAQPILDFLRRLEAEGGPYHDAPLPHMDSQLPHHAQWPEGHFNRNNLSKAKDEITHRVLEVAGNAFQQSMGSLYEDLKKTSFRLYEFRLLEQITPDHPKARELAEFALWLLHNSPDPQPVKYALILLGALDERDHQAIYQTFAGHDAFTYQAQRALMGTRPVEDSRDQLFYLAKTLSGWGKIDAIIPLCEWAEGYYDVDGTAEETSLELRDEFRHWLVRGGYRNAINDDLIAERTAVFGHLEEQLAAPGAVQDIELLDHAARIFTPVFYPARWSAYEGEHGGASYSDYHDTVVFNNPERAVSAWLDHVLQHRLTWGRVCVAARIKADIFGEQPLFRLSDDPTILPRLDAYMQNPDLEPLLKENYGDDDPLVRREAFFVADMAGIDYWPVLFDSIDPAKCNETFVWVDLCRNQDPLRAEKVAGLLLRHLEWGLSGEGPAALDKEETLSRIDWDGLRYGTRMLRGFPGVGWPMLAYALRLRPSRGVAGQVLCVLDGWPRDAWPSEAIPLLRQALSAGAFSNRDADAVSALLKPGRSEPDR